MEIEHSSITVKIQWGKQKLEYELDTRDDMATFRAKLYSITFVPEEKQKIIFGGKTLKDDTVLADLKKLKPGAIFMLMGTAEGKGLNLVQAGPKKKIRRRHDRTGKTRILQRCSRRNSSNRNKQSRQHLLPKFHTPSFQENQRIETRDHGCQTYSGTISDRNERIIFTAGKLW